MWIYPSVFICEMLQSNYWFLSTLDGNESLYVSPNTFEWMKLSKDIPGPQRMNPNTFGDPPIYSITGADQNKNKSKAWQTKTWLILI